MNETTLSKTETIAVAIIWMAVAFIGFFGLVFLTSPFIFLPQSPPLNSDTFYLLCALMPLPLLVPLAAIWGGVIATKSIIALAEKRLQKSHPSG